MQRACLPSPDYETTTLPPSSCSRQHHERVAGPFCAPGGCNCRSLRSTTRPHHRHLSPPRLAVCCVMISHTTHCCKYDSDNRQQQQSAVNTYEYLFVDFGMGPCTTHVLLLAVVVVLCNTRSRSSLPSIVSILFLRRTDRVVCRQFSPFWFWFVHMAVHVYTYVYYTKYTVSFFPCNHRTHGCTAVRSNTICLSYCVYYLLFLFVFLLR